MFIVWFAEGLVELTAPSGMGKRNYPISLEDGGYQGKISFFYNFYKQSIFVTVRNECQKYSKCPTWGNFDPQ